MRRALLGPETSNYAARVRPTDCGLCRIIDVRLHTVACNGHGWLGALLFCHAHRSNFSSNQCRLPQAPANQRGTFIDAEQIGHARGAAQRPRRARRRHGPHSGADLAFVHRPPVPGFLHGGDVFQGRAGGSGHVPAHSSGRHDARARCLPAVLPRPYPSGGRADQQRSVRGREPPAGHLPVQAGLRRRDPHRLRVRDGPPHRHRRPSPRGQRHRQHRDLPGGAAPSSAEAVRARRAERDPVPDHREGRAGARAGARGPARPGRGAGVRRARAVRPGRALRDRGPDRL